MRSGIVAHQDMIARPWRGIAEGLRMGTVHLVLRRRVGGDIDDGRGVKGALVQVNQRDRALVIAMRKECDHHLVGPGHLMPVIVAVGGVVAEDQFRVRPVGTDGPERVPEVGSLILILRPRP